MLRNLLLRRLRKVQARRQNVDFGVFYARQFGVVVGEGCRIYTEDFGSEPWLIEVGDNTTISANITFVTHDGAAWLASDENGRRYRYARISVGRRCFVGANSTILPGVRIGDDCIIGAGTVLTKSVPNGITVAGNPARYIGATEDYITRALAEYRSESSMPVGVYRHRTEVACESTYRAEISHAH